MASTACGQFGWVRLSEVCAVKIEVWEPRYLDHLRSRGLAERTIHGYLAEMRAFLRFLADRQVTEPHQITRDEVDAYQLSLFRRRKSNGEPLAVGTRQLKVISMLQFLRFLHKSQVILVNPGRHVYRPTTPRRLLPELPTEEQVLALLETPDVTTPLGLRNRAILELLYSSALRNKELRGLRILDLDLTRLELRIRKGKGSKPRVVPMGEPAANWLEKYMQDGRTYFLRRPENSSVFLGVYGKTLSNGALCKMVRKHGKLARIPCHVTPHILRHSCATHMLARGADIRYLQEILGHASPETTQIYTQVARSQLREIHQRCHPRESF